VRVNFQEWPLSIKPLPRHSFAEANIVHTPLIRKERE
jgi:hypothetical protein